MNPKLLTSILQSSNELITSESFLTKHHIGNAFTRSGKLSFQNLIYFILQSVHKSISITWILGTHNEEIFVHPINTRFSRIRYLVMSLHMTRTYFL